MFQLQKHSCCDPTAAAPSTSPNCQNFCKHGRTFLHTAQRICLNWLAILSSCLWQSLLHPALIGYDAVPYKCSHPSCNKSFGLKHNLQRHQTRVHGRLPAKKQPPRLPHKLAMYTEQMMNQGWIFPDSVVPGMSETSHRSSQSLQDIQDTGSYSRDSEKLLPDQAAGLITPIRDGTDGSDSTLGQSGGTEKDFVQDNPSTENR